MNQPTLFETGTDLRDIVHLRENSKENEKHLNANRKTFNRQCAQVLSLLLKGVVLTTRDALLIYKIGDLRRRIKDLKDAGVEIQEDWALDENGQATRYKKWFIKNGD